ncbi:hypothetical protein [Bacillus thuringiensis]|nr:hypothetical protein [Bacillus thuringiensis]
MPTKDVAKEIYFAVRNEDGTYGVPILVKPMKEDLYADSDDNE